MIRREEFERHDDEQVVRVVLVDQVAGARLGHRDTTRSRVVTLPRNE
jgi:hypothetical protein